MTIRFHTTKFRTTIAGLAALAAFSTTGVASAAVPGALGDTPMTVQPTTEGSVPASGAPADTATGVSGTATVAPENPSHIAQVFRPDLMKKKNEICRNYQLLYEASVADAVQIDGNPDGSNQSDADAAAADQAANQTRDAAKQAGCGWAA